MLGGQVHVVWDLQPGEAQRLTKCMQGKVATRPNRSKGSHGTGPGPASLSRPVPTLLFSLGMSLSKASCFCLHFGEVEFALGAPFTPTVPAVKYE